MCIRDSPYQRPQWQVHRGHVPAHLHAASWLLVACRGAIDEDAGQREREPGPELRLAVQEPHR
eukprot:6127945-Alexandrium_andersonii.AAC.1